MEYVYTMPTHFLSLTSVCVVGKVTLDIICDTAFGYKTDCLHNPHNELAVAFEHLLQLQSGPNLAKLVAILSIPGSVQLSKSGWMYRHRRFIGKLPVINDFEQLVESLHRIRTISADMLSAKISDLSVAPDDTSDRLVLGLFRVVPTSAELNANADSLAAGERPGEPTQAAGRGHPDLRSQPTSGLPNAQEPHLARLRRVQHPTSPKLADTHPSPSNESLRVLPPVPLTLRVADKTDYIEGVLVPKGTVITIPVRIPPHRTPPAHRLQIRVINTWKQLWGDDAEECVPLANKLTD
jgi:hypothetical protein